MAINRIQDHNILLIFGHKFFIRRSFTICSVFLDKCISCDFCDYLKPLLLIPFRSGRNGQSFSYRYANRYQNTPRSTSGQISGRFKPFRSFQTISANFGRDVNSSRYMIQLVKKKKKKKKKKKTNKQTNKGSNDAGLPFA